MSFMLISLMYSYWYLPASYNAMTEYGRGCRAFEHIFSQAECGACGAFALASVYGMRSCKNGGNDLPSPYRIFDCANSDCKLGMSITSLAASMRIGVTDLAQTPPVYGWGCPSAGGPVRIRALIPIMTTSFIKRDILANGPVLASVTASDEYMSYSTGVHADGVIFPGNHMVAVIGWGAATDTEPEHWIIQNSWSSDWGEGGRGKHVMSYFDVMFTVYTAYAAQHESRR